MQRTRILHLALLLACVLITSGCDLWVDADKRVARAKERMTAGDYAAALIDLKNVVQSEPGHVEGRLLLAEATLWLGDATTAEWELRRAIEAGAAVEATAELAARIALAQREFGTLLARIDAGELPLPEPERSIYRGRALLGSGRVDAAVEMFQAALTVSAQSEAARLGLAEALSVQGRIDDALAQLDQVIEVNPSSAAAHLARGTILMRRGQLAAAQQALEAARTHRGSLTAYEQIAVLGALAETQLAERDLSAAAATHRELATLAGENAPVARLMSARIAMSRQDYVQASADLQRVVTQAPDFARARFLLGAVLAAQGNLNQAELQLTRALQLAPENLEARRLLAQVRLRMERPEAAMEVLLPAQQGDLNDPYIDMLIGAAHLQRGDSSQGTAQLERALQRNPDNRTVKIELAGAYARAGEYAKATALLKQMPHVAGDLRREQLLVAVYAASNELGAARSELERLIKDHPRDVAVLNLAAAFLAWQRDFESARNLLAQADEAKPNEPATLMNRARVEILAGEPRAASQWLQRLAAMELSAAARLTLADLALYAGDAATALRLLEELRKQDVQAVDARVRLAGIYFQRREQAQADVVLKELLELATERPEVLNAVGLLLMENGRHEEALSQFRAATAQAPDRAAHWLNLSRAQLALGYESAARESLEKALSVQPNWTAAVGVVSMMDLRAGRRDAAVARLSDLKKAKPDDPEVHALEGDLQMALQDYVRAAGAYARALELKPDVATVIKAFRARQLGKLPDATAPLQAWLAQRPNHSEVRAVLAEAYQTAGQRALAIEQYELILESDPNRAGVLNNLAWLYYEAGDDRAEAMAQRAYQALPEHPAIADTYGWILVERGKVDQGVQVLKAAVAAAGGNPDIEYHYAAALARSGARQEAHERLVRLMDRGVRFASEADARRLMQELAAR